MKIVCSQDELLGRLQIAARGVSQRSTVQILSGAPDRRDADGPVELAATDMELSVRVPSAGPVSRSRATVLPGRLLLEIVRALPPADVDDRADRGHGRRADQCGPSEYSLHTQSAEDFPQILPVPSRAVVHRRARSLRRHGRPRRSGGVQGRVAAGADRDPGRVRRRHGDHGRHRQLPAVRQGGGRCPVPPATAQAIVPARALVEVTRIAAALDGGRPRGRRSARTRCCSAWTASGCRRAASTASSRTTASCCRRRSSTRSRSPRTSCWTSSGARR